MCESRPWPIRIVSKDTSNSFVFFRAPGSQPVLTENTQKGKEGKAPGGEENKQCLYRSEEVRGKVPGTTCNGACFNSANIQTLGDVGRQREWRSASAYKGTKPKSQPHITAPVAGATYDFLLFIKQLIKQCIFTKIIFI